MTNRIINLGISNAIASNYASLLVDSNNTILDIIDNPSSGYHCFQLSDDCIGMNLFDAIDSNSDYDSVWWQIQQIDNLSVLSWTQDDIYNFLTSVN
jgi:hypothetical protein